MKLFDYSQYDALHNSLVDYYGSEAKLKIAILKDQHPTMWHAIWGDAMADGALAFRRMSSAIYDANQAMQKLTISYPVVKREAHFRSIWGADDKNNTDTTR